MKNPFTHETPKCHGTGLSLLISTSTFCLHALDITFLFRGPGFGYWISGTGFGNQGIEICSVYISLLWFFVFTWHYLPCPGTGFWGPNFGDRISGTGFRGPDFGIRKPSQTNSFQSLRFVLSSVVFFLNYWCIVLFLRMVFLAFRNRGY